jgi:hypothetical protein
MSRPTHDDPDLNKASPKASARGKRDAHQRQTPNDYAPQRPEKDDVRQPRLGDRPKRRFQGKREQDQFRPNARGRGG